MIFTDKEIDDIELNQLEKEIKHDFLILKVSIKLIGYLVFCILLFHIVDIIFFRSLT